MSSLFNTQDPAIADAFMLVCDALTEIEDRNLYERQGTSAVDDEQAVLTIAVRDRTEAVKRAARKLIEMQQVDRSKRRRLDPLVEVVALDDWRAA